MFGARCSGVFPKWYSVVLWNPGSATWKLNVLTLTCCWEIDNFNLPLWVCLYFGLWDTMVGVKGNTAVLGDQTWDAFTCIPVFWTSSLPLRTRSSAHPLQWTLFPFLSVLFSCPKCTLQISHHYSVYVFLVSSITSLYHILWTVTIHVYHKNCIYSTVAHFAPGKCKGLHLILATACPPWPDMAPGKNLRLACFDWIPTITYHVLLDTTRNKYTVRRSPGGSVPNPPKKSKWKVP